MMDINTLQSFVQFIMPTGRAALVGLIGEFKQAYGKDWLTKFREENKEYSFLMDIIANHDAPAAFLALKAFVDEQIDGEDMPMFQKGIIRGAATGILNGNYSHIIETHRVLREEIDRPRF